uniref:Uncharacterized protein n=1 Tax=Arundo donax TaxID=35708 RepID=A0A0A8ZCH8_ARUDO
MDLAMLSLYSMLLHFLSRI